MNIFCLTVSKVCGASSEVWSKGLFHLIADGHDHDRKYDKDDKRTTHEIMGEKKLN